MTQQNEPTKCPACDRTWKGDCPFPVWRCENDWHREPAATPEGETNGNRSDVQNNNGSTVPSVGSSSSDPQCGAVASPAQSKIHSAVIETCDTVRAQGFFSQEKRDLLLQYSEDLYLMGLRDAGKTDVVASPTMSAASVYEVHPDAPPPSCHACGAMMIPTEWKCSSCGTTISPSAAPPRLRLEPCATDLYRQGFETAHELRDCGHSRGDYRDPKYGTPEYEGDEQCVGCQREARLREQVRLADELVNSDGHTTKCRFTGCTCGGAERYAAARTNYMREARAASEDKVSESIMNILSREEHFMGTVYALRTLLVEKGILSPEEIDYHFCEWAEKNLRRKDRDLPLR